MAYKGGIAVPRHGFKSSKLGNALQLANHPTVRPRGHEHNVVNNDGLIVDDLPAVQNLQLILRGVMQLDNVALGGVKHSFQFVILIPIPLAEAGTLLVGNRFAQPVLRLSRKGSIQRVLSIKLQGLGHAGPCDAIVADDSTLGQVLDRSRTGVLRIQLYLYRRLRCARIEGGSQEQSNGCQRGRNPRRIDACCAHGCAPIRSSFPNTMPEAAEITAAPAVAICARAIPCLMGASTVLFPFAPVAVNVTMVPSGKEFPAQS